MTKKEFINELESKMKKAGKQNDFLRVSEYFIEMIDDMIENGVSEEGAVGNLGDIDEIIREYSGDESIPPEPNEGIVKSTFPESEIRKLTISDFNNSFEIIPTSGDKFEVTSFETEEKGYEIKEVGDELRIIAFRKETGIRKWFHFDVRSKTLVVKVPKNFRGDIDASTTNGSARVERLACGDVVIKTRNGALHLDTIAANTINASSTNGAIRSATVKAKSITLGTSNGSVYLDSVATENLKASSSNGPFHVSTVAAETIDLHTSNGSMSVNKVAAERSISMTSSNGSITGVIGGKMSDYAITSSTSNAKNNLPNGTSGPKKLHVSTSNARINIDFCEK